METDWNIYSDRIIPEIKLSELLDLDAVKSMMESFYLVSGVPMSIVDLDGNVLAGAGWQDICSDFHRKNELSLKNCHDSDTILTAGIPAGEFRVYKCRNGMWDMATPLFFEKHRIGNLFTGQFFFKDEEPDIESFSKQAKKYGYNEEEYISALKKVPRLERSSLERAKSFMVKLADTLAQLGYSKFKLEKALRDSKILLSNLRYSKYLLEQAESIAHLGSWEYNHENATLTWSDEVYRIFGVVQLEFEPGYDNFLECVHPDDRKYVSESFLGTAKSDDDSFEIQHRLIRQNTKEVILVREKCKHFRNISGEIIRSVGMIQEIPA